MKSGCSISGWSSSGGGQEMILSLHTLGFSPSSRTSHHNLFKIDKRKHVCVTFQPKETNHSRTWARLKGPSGLSTSRALVLTEGRSTPTAHSELQIRTVIRVVDDQKIKTIRVQTATQIDIIRPGVTFEWSWSPPPLQRLFLMSRRRPVDGRNKAPVEEKREETV